jgi:hypothetical protein
LVDLGLVDGKRQRFFPFDKKKEAEDEMAIRQALIKKTPAPFHSDQRHAYLANGFHVHV